MRTCIGRICDYMMIGGLGDGLLHHVTAIAGSSGLGWSHRYGGCYGAQRHVPRKVATRPACFSLAECKRFVPIGPEFVYDLCVSLG